MRLAATICALLLCAATSFAAERDWKTGMWAVSADARRYTIEAAAEIVTAEAPPSGPAQTFAATPGTSVQYAIDGRTLYVLDTDKVEHALTLVKVDSRYSSNYSAPGSGHYIKAVAPGGMSVTLEDGSHWDVDPRTHFSVAAWQPEDLISVRRSHDDPSYAYEIDNTSRDEGSLANYRVR